jgi:hypothetical protein
MLLKMGIGNAWAVRLQNFSCAKTLRAWKIAQRFWSRDSLIFLVIHKELCRRANMVFCGVARHGVPRLHRIDYVARCMSTMIRSMSYAPQADFCHWLKTLALTEAYCCEGDWKLTPIPDFAIDEYSRRAAVIDEFVQLVGVQLGAEARSVVEKKMARWATPRIAEYDGLPLNVVENMLGEAAHIYEECCAREFSETRTLEFACPGSER